MLPLISKSDRLGWTSQNERLSASLQSCLERLECLKEDEYHFASPEFVDGIPPFACEFAGQNQNAHLLAAADEDGHVVIYDTNLSGQQAKVKEWSAHNNAVFDIAWSSTDPRLVTASGDQSAALWDVETYTQLASFKQHRCSLKSVSFRPWDGHVFATGARDGNIMIWDDRYNKKGKDPSHHKPVGEISGAHIDQNKMRAQPKRRRKLAPNLPAVDSSQSVSVVLFQTEDTLLSAGAADGIVKVWDLRKLKTSGASTPTPLHQFPYSGSSNRKRGFSSLTLGSTRTQLFANCTDSVIYEYDLGGALRPQPVNRYRGHINSTFFVRAALSPDDLFLLSGSSDNHAYIWKVGEPDCPPVTLIGHEAEVTSVAWCPRDFTKIVSCSDDNTLCIWRLPSRRSIDDGLNRVIGKARRCKIEVDSQGNSEPPSYSQASNSPRSGCDSNRTTPTSETGESSQTPQHSPMPSSTKKRKFSLRDWVTASPRPSRPASPVSPTKRRKSESTPNGPNVSDNCTAVENERENKKNVVGNKRRAHRCSQDEAASISKCPKKIKMSDDGASAPPSMKSTLHKKVDKTVSQDRENSVQEQESALHNLVLNDEQIVSKSEEGLINDSEETSLDKENVLQNRPDDKPIQSKTSSNSTSCRRSPLKDDIPMNCATSKLHPAKKNIASTFPNSSKSSNRCDRSCDKEESVGEKQQQNLKACFKDKKVGGLIQSKRRNSMGTIDCYFQPLQKRHKSEI